jgi:NAD(P)-dependent dehydrogenase (short-subunit alcohol dehydrogenase family)
LKIIVIGAKGAVGQAAIEALGDRHEIITVGRSSGDFQIDIEDQESLRSMYNEVGKVDAVISAVGHGHFGGVAEMSSDQFMKGITHKVLPQVNLVLVGIDHMNDGGSFTLTSGVLNRDPIRGGASAAAANGALDGFVLGAAIDMPRGIRINAVSPGLLQVSVDRYDGFFPGHEPVSSERVGLAYCKSVEGAITGQVIIVD